MEVSTRIEQRTADNAGALHYCIALPWQHCTRDRKDNRLRECFRGSATLTMRNHQQSTAGMITLMMTRTHMSHLANNEYSILTICVGHIEK